MQAKFRRSLIASPRYMSCKIKFLRDILHYVIEGIVAIDARCVRCPEFSGSSKSRSLQSQVADGAFSWLHTR
jgi:hypothetical protein